jgi:hypothetical protein
MVAQKIKFVMFFTSQINIEVKLPIYIWIYFTRNKIDNFWKFFWCLKKNVREKC